MFDEVNILLYFSIKELNFKELYPQTVLDLKSIFKEKFWMCISYLLKNLSKLQYIFIPKHKKKLKKI